MNSVVVQLVISVGRASTRAGSWEGKTSQIWMRIVAMNRSDVGQASQPAGSRGIFASYFERQDAARTGRQDVCPTGSWKGRRRTAAELLVVNPDLIVILILLLLSE